MEAQYILEGGIHDTYIWLQKHKAPENKCKDYYFSNNEKKPGAYDTQATKVYLRISME